MLINLSIRKAKPTDLKDICMIYNQGIEDRVATLESEQKDLEYMQKWYEDHTDKYSIIVAELEGSIVGWASLNPYSHRCAYKGVADLSIYIRRDYRGKGVGSSLLVEIERYAKENEFYKIVLFTFPFNELGQGLYRKKGYREVGVFEKQGFLDGKYIDVMIMEKLLF